MGYMVLSIKRIMRCPRSHPQFLGGECCHERYTMLMLIYGLVVRMLGCHICKSTTCTHKLSSHIWGINGDPWDLSSLFIYFVICGNSFLISLISHFKLNWKATIISKKLKEKMRKLLLKSLHKSQLDASQMIPAHRLSDFPDIKQLWPRVTDIPTCARCSLWLRVVQLAVKYGLPGR